MNSIERVKAALYFAGPDRVPVFKAGLGDVLPAVMLPSKKWKPGHDENEKGLFPHVADDIIIKLGLFKWKKPEWARVPEYRGKKWLKYPREEIDEWGCIWVRKGNNITMGHPGRPSLTDYGVMDRYLEKYTPDPSDRSRYSLFVKIMKIFGRKKYRLCTLGYYGPSQTAAAMRGFTRYLTDHRRHPEELKKLLEHLTEFYIQCIKYWIKYSGGSKPHGFWLVDDLGEQRGPFFGPKTFREFYTDVYGRIIKTAHDYGCEVHLHSCGKIDKLLPILIEWGLDAVEFDSPRMTGYPALRPFRGKIMFWGCINIQSIYPNGTPEECEREVWHMIRNLGTPSGGFGAYFYPQVRHIKVPRRNIKAFKKGLKKYGIYARIPEEWWNIPTEDDWDDKYVPPLPPYSKNKIHE